MSTEENYVIHLDYSERSHVLTGRPTDEMREELKSQKVATYHPRLYVVGTTPIKGWLIKKDQLEKAKEIIERCSKQKVKVQNLTPYSEFKVLGDGKYFCIIDKVGSSVGLSIKEEEEKVFLIWNGWKSFKTFKDWQEIDLSTASLEKLREFLARVEFYETYRWYPNSAKKIKSASIQLLKDFMLTYRGSLLSKEILEVLTGPIEKVFHNSIESQKNHIEVFCEKKDGLSSWYCKSAGSYVGLTIRQNNDDTPEFDWNVLDEQDKVFGTGGPVKFLRYLVESFFKIVERDLQSPSEILPTHKTLETVMAAIEVIERFNSEGNLENIGRDIKDFLAQPKKIFESSLKYFG